MSMKDVAARRRRGEAALARLLWLQGLALYSQDALYFLSGPSVLDRPNCVEGGLPSLGRFEVWVMEVRPGAAPLWPCRRLVLTPSPEQDAGDVLEEVSRISRDRRLRGGCPGALDRDIDRRVAEARERALSVYRGELEPRVRSCLDAFGQMLCPDTREAALYWLDMMELQFA